MYSARWVVVACGFLLGNEAALGNDAFDCQEGGIAAACRRWCASDPAAAAGEGDSNCDQYLPRQSAAPNPRPPITLPASMDAARASIRREEVTVITSRSRDQNFAFRRLVRTPTSCRYPDCVFSRSQFQGADMSGLELTREFGPMCCYGAKFDEFTILPEAWGSTWEERKTYAREIAHMDFDPFNPAVTVLNRLAPDEQARVADIGGRLSEIPVGDGSTSGSPGATVAQ